MELIDRYLYAVASHLPENIREDVKRELQANIEDMLPESPSEDDVKEILRKLGNPSKLADEYRQVKRYLIGPGLYDNYLSVLKLVVIIASSILASIALVEGILRSPGNSGYVGVTIKVLTDMVSAAIEGAMQATIWVTLSFVILERTGVNEGKMPFGKKEWSPEDLPPLSDFNKRKISRGETVFSMIFLIIFVSIIFFQPQLIGIYTKDQNGLVLSAPLFASERPHFYLIFIILITFIEFSILIYKFILKKWSLPLAIVNAIYNIAACVLVCIMIVDKSLINPDFIIKLSSSSNISLADIRVWGVNSLWISAVVFISISLWDSITAFVKLKNY